MVCSASLRAWVSLEASADPKSRMIYLVFEGVLEKRSIFEHHVSIAPAGACNTVASTCERLPHLNVVSTHADGIYIRTQH